MTETRLERKKLKRWRFMSRKDNPANFEGRLFSVGRREDPDDVEEDDIQRHFSNNAVKSSKYTWITFLPRNLFEQFRRVANFYFLIVAVIQLTVDTPVPPFTSISPLIFVVAVTMTKQGYEDYKRHVADRIINKRMVTKLEKDIVVEIHSEAVQVGDILWVEDGDEICCDMALLSTSNTNGKASVMTANLDGETNLKTRQATSITKHLRSHELNSLQGHVECENPNPDLGRFLGRIRLRNPETGQEEISALGPENILLRGTKLKNTDHVFGVAVYTGPDTKMSMNSRRKANKFSSIEKTMNKVLLAYIVVLLLEILIATTTMYSLGIDMEAKNVPWYIHTPADQTFGKITQSALSFLVLFNYIIPISLYVTLELQKFFGSFFLAWDLDMYDEQTDQPAKTNTSDLNEELGQVEYLFSDKTGTLTENEMIFKECSINGVTFKDIHENLICDDLTKHDEGKVTEFLLSLCLCHTVQATRKITSQGQSPLDLIYNASSPDEKAIVEACRNYGIAFLGEIEEDSVPWYDVLVSRSSKMIQLSFEKLHVCEFDSDRKCMSIIVRDYDGDIQVISKGAENAILPRCPGGNSSGLKYYTSNHINNFAARGLRTLAVASKPLTSKKYKDFCRKFEKANQALDRRREKVRKVYDELESGLNLLGAIGVEDKLQEDVKNTLESLGDAGIKVWILTGDKKETAINISQSCGHLQSNMSLIDIAGLEKKQIDIALKQKLEQCQASQDTDSKGLIVDGKTLLSIFVDKHWVEMLRSLSSACRSVICCRMSPLQKAEIVKMIKNSADCPITASVGDGANDVAMIQEAHVGLGIAGKEGRAAVRSSDYALAKFKHLKKVLLVHGHWFYYRAAILVQYFFFKNLAAFTGQVVFILLAGFSDQNLFDPINLTLYNIIYTSLPIFIFGLFEQNLCSQTLMSCPEYYKGLQRNSLMSMKQCFVWAFEGIWFCFISFFLFYKLWTSHLNETTKRSLQLPSYGLSIYQSILVSVSLRLLIHARYLSTIFVCSIVFSMLAFSLITMGYEGIEVGVKFHEFLTGRDFNNPDVHEMPVDFDTYWVIFECYKTLPVWLTTFACIVISLLPFTLMSVVRNTPAIYKLIMRKSDYSANPDQPDIPDEDLYINFSRISRSYQPSNNDNANNGFNNQAFCDDECQIQITKL